MFRVKTMSRLDFPFAVKITDQMNWGMVEEDFEFMTELEPEGCFVLLSGRERVGIATTVSFGKKGWFGNLIVKKSHRDEGAGSMLVEYSLEYLKSRGVKTVGLYAYVDKVNFYRRLGFEYDSEFTVLKGKGFSSAKSEGVVEVGRKNMRQITDFDNLCFGSHRVKVLDPILGNPNNVGYMCRDEDKMLGYVLAKVYDGIADLGPLGCLRERSDVAVDLLDAILGRLKDADVSCCLPKKEKPLLSRLMEHGFVESFPVTRMFLHPSDVNDCVYIAESLERG
jgi:N-acetylglutamate synthase-like GNAT family acetyltransferase